MHQVLQTLELTVSSLHLITLRAMENWKNFTNIKNLHSNNCEKDLANWDKYTNLVLTIYRVTSNLATVETSFFLVYRRDPHLTLHELLEPMQHFLGDLESEKFNLEHHCLTLAIGKKMLDKNCFKNTQKTTDWKSPSLQLGNRVYFKNKQ